MSIFACCGSKKEEAFGLQVSGAAWVFSHGGKELRGRQGSLWFDYQVDVDRRSSLSPVPGATSPGGGGDSLEPSLVLQVSTAKDIFSRGSQEGCRLESDALPNEEKSTGLREEEWRIWVFSASSLFQPW